MPFSFKHLFRQPVVFIALIVVIVGVLLYRADVFYLKLIELKTLDYRFLIRDEIQAGSKIVLAVVDEKSLDREGKWPWPRTKIARLVEQLSAAGASVIAFDIGFSEPDDKRVIHTISKIRKTAIQYGIKDAAYFKYLETLAEKTDNDSALAEAIRNAKSRIVLGWFFHTDTDVENVGHLDEKVIAQNEKNIRAARYLYKRSDAGARMRASSLTRIAPEPNILQLSDATDYAGYFNFVPDQDGVIRRMHAVLEYNDNVYAPLSLMALSAYFGLPLHLEIGGQGEILGACIGDRVCVPTDENGRMMINYRGADRTFPYISATDILNNQVSNEQIRDKIVIVGATAIGTYDLVVTPFSNTFPGPEIHANIVDNILTGDFIQQLEAFKLIDLFMIVCSGLILSALLTRVGMIAGSTVALLMLVGYSVFCQFLFTQYGLVLNMIYPLLVMLAVYIAVTAYKYLTEESQKRFIRNTFSRYLAPTVVEQLIGSGQEVELGGEQREITAFFSDVQGFTSISEKLRPSELVELLNEFLTEMTDIILKYEGTVDKFEGDAIIAFFGAPNILKNHAETATLACIEMQNKMAGLRRTWREQGRPELKMRIGLYSGTAVVGNMGSRNRMDYTMMGDTVNTAARLEGVNKVYGTYTMIGESTAEVLDDRIVCREIDSIHVVGKQVPVAVYEPFGFRSDVDDRTMKTVELYHAGLAAYRKRDWPAAGDLFRRALSLSPEDGPSKTLLARCEAYQLEPPPADWDGAFTMQTK